jgi:hypothetical protein
VAEVPTNRVIMEQNGALPALLHLMRLDDSRVHRDCMRTLSLLAEATPNRVSMSYRTLDVVAEMLWNDDQATQADAIRCVANIVAPAGIVSQKSARTLKLEQAVPAAFKAHMAPDQTQESSLKGSPGSSHKESASEEHPEGGKPAGAEAALATPEFMLFGKYGSNHRRGEEVSESESDDEQDPEESEEAKARAKEKLMAELTHFKEVFDELDTDGSGSLQPPEVAKLCETMGKPLTNVELKDAMATMDHDGK